MDKNKLKQLLKKVKVKPEAIQECEHTQLRQLVKFTAWYQCENPQCRTIFFLRDIPGWQPDQFVKLLGVMVKEIKERDENLPKK